MAAFLAALIVVVGIGFGASKALETYQRSADAAFVGSGAQPTPEKPHSGAPKS